MSSFEEDDISQPSDVVPSFSLARGQGALGPQGQGAGRAQGQGAGRAQGQGAVGAQGQVAPTAPVTEDFFAAVTGNPENFLLSTAVDLSQVVTNAVAPLIAEAQKLQKENKQQSLKILGMQNTLAGNQIILKELQENMHKGKKPLKSLLKTHGVELLRRKVWQSMHLSAGSDEENGVWNQLLYELRDNELFISDSAKDIADLLKCFHEERSVLKQQVPARIDLDFSNKSPATGVTLTKTFSYLAARNMALSGTDLLRLYNLAYVKAQYLNEKVVLLTPKSINIRSTSEKGLWMGLHKRMQKSTASLEEMKQKINDSLKDGYKPLKK